MGWKALLCRDVRCAQRPGGGDGGGGSGAMAVFARAPPPVHLVALALPLTLPLRVTEPRLPHPPGGPRPVPYFGPPFLWPFFFESLLPICQLRGSVYACKKGTRRENGAGCSAGERVLLELLSTLRHCKKYATHARNCLQEQASRKEASGVSMTPCFRIG